MLGTFCRGTPYVLERSLDLTCSGVRIMARSLAAEQTRISFVQNGHTAYFLSFSSLHPSRCALLVPACRSTLKSSTYCGGSIGTQRVQGCGDCKSVASTFRPGVEQGILGRGRRVMGASAHLDRSARSVGDARLSWKSHVTVSRSGGVRGSRLLCLGVVIRHYER